MSETLDEQIEALRIQEVKEGKLFDCYLKYNAARIYVEGRARCRGHEIGVGGRGVSLVCLTCTCYHVS